jgi:hypothetical protein
MPWQHILPGKALMPSDAEMDADELKYAARRRLERVAAWRQMQGYSNQLRCVTRHSNPPVTMASFPMPDNATVRPVNAGERRCVERGRHQDVAYIVDQAGVRHAVLPPAPIKIPLLVLGLDQGGVGSAGCAFMPFALNYNVYSRFDKIHRLIRDLKGAEGNCCKEIFTKSKLWSAYLWSINKRPFGSGTNATQKELWMTLFARRCDITSEVFLKYLPKIAKGWKGHSALTKRSKESSMPASTWIPSVSMGATPSLPTGLHGTKQLTIRSRSSMQAR